MRWLSLCAVALLLAVASAEMSLAPGEVLASEYCEHHFVVGHAPAQVDYASDAFLEECEEEEDDYEDDECFLEEDADEDADAEAEAEAEDGAEAEAEAEDGAEAEAEAEDGAEAEAEAEDAGAEAEAEAEAEDAGAEAEAEAEAEDEVDEDDVKDAVAAAEDKADAVDELEELSDKVKKALKDHDDDDDDDGKAKAKGGGKCKKAKKCPQKPKKKCKKKPKKKKCKPKPPPPKPKCRKPKPKRKAPLKCPEENDPKVVDPARTCRTCILVVDTLIKMVDNTEDNDAVADAMNDLCTQQRVGRRYFKACEYLLEDHSAKIKKVLATGQTNDPKTVCEQINVCQDGEGDDNGRKGDFEEVVLQCKPRKGRIPGNWARMRATIKSGQLVVVPDAGSASKKPQGARAFKGGKAAMDKLRRKR